MLFVLYVVLCFCLGWFANDYRLRMWQRVSIALVGYVLLTLGYEILKK